MSANGMPIKFIQLSWSEFNMHFNHTLIANLASLNLTKSRALKTSLVLLSGVALSGCFDNAASEAEFEKPIPDVVDFNFDVKPILSDTCFLCHAILIKKMQKQV